MLVLNLSDSKACSMYVRSAITLSNEPVFRCHLIKALAYG